MHKNSRGKLSGAVRDETLAEVQRQEEEVSSRDKSAISPDTDAVPMRRWRTDSILEEASQYRRPKAGKRRDKARGEEAAIQQG